MRTDKSTTPETHGTEGVCLACQSPISSHVDKKGKWIGCKGCNDDETHFLLVPVPPREPAPNGTKPTPIEIDRARFRYIPTDARRKPALSATRASVYESIRASKNPLGLLARDILAETKLTHGSVQQTLNWLRGQKLIKAVKVQKPAVH